VQCYPPSLEITWQWSAELEGDVNAQAEFKAWLEGFKVRYAALLAALKRAELVAKVGVDLGAAAQGAVKGAVDVAAQGEVTLKVGVGLACAVTELEKVGGVISGAAGKLQGSVQGAVEVTGAIAGGG
jgi:hypothetical protein